MSSHCTTDIFTLYVNYISVKLVRGEKGFSPSDSQFGQWRQETRNKWTNEIILDNDEHYEGKKEGKVLWFDCKYE